MSLGQGTFDSRQGKAWWSSPPSTRPLPQMCRWLQFYLCRWCYAFRWPSPPNHKAWLQGCCLHRKQNLLRLWMLSIGSWMSESPVVLAKDLTSSMLLMTPSFVDEYILRRRDLSLSLLLEISVTLLKEKGERGPGVNFCTPVNIPAYMLVNTPSAKTPSPIPASLNSWWSWMSRLPCVLLSYIERKFCPFPLPCLIWLQMRSWSSSWLRGAGLLSFFSLICQYPFSTRTLLGRFY